MPPMALLPFSLAHLDTQIWNGITSIPKEDHILVMLLSQVGKGVEEYSATDMDGIREDWSIYAVTSIFK
ncbi:hypothetical protein HanPSC8_Chr10g0443091 [Helianthus annuus]|nr:hypothetical protein HanPSC8_Chr14g0614901 [Helianthus annuus]KAJ0885242.1 hypothetical protein HanPSC8_Chr10g0443091 [Helianthus annuus]